ncbi:MAG: hypothetical protein K5922_08950 [Clostridiales bacterium]|nr:hypothetical protein [Clostridiales bacterium]
MRKGLFALAALIVLMCFVLPASVGKAESTDEWTVLFYMCGSDLESKYSYGTGNLEEIIHVTQAKSSIVSDRAGKYDQARGKVNVLIETGGAKEWHAQDLGMDIRTDALQIWRYDAAMDTDRGTFALEAEKPLASMADPDTLSEFIRWGTEHYPAKKYALVLWNHGGGSATGIFIDELFGGEYMTLDLLNQAMADGGVYFEAVLFDACMMANIETAYAVRNYAGWMIASEELVAGKGSAIGEWLQELYCVPTADGRLLGRWICDTAVIKYANSGDSQAQELLTWSVIDLSKIPRLVECFDGFFADMSIFYMEDPSVLVQFSKAAFFSEAYGIGHENMYDLSGILFTPFYRSSMNADRQTAMQYALVDAVDYCVRGTGRPAARGISFCYATNFSEKKLDVYARNCPSPNYLALLDAISSWEAPEEVYKRVIKLPEQEGETAYQIQVEKKNWKNGCPSFSVLAGEMNITMVQYELYKYDERTEQIIRLGSVPSYYDEEEGVYRVYDLSQWPAIDGNICQIELQNVTGYYNILYNIPVMLDSELMNMRCGYLFDTAEYRIYGLWEGYDSDSSQFNRNVKSLAQVAGLEYNLLYEVYTGESDAKKSYTLSPTMIMYRSIVLEEITLLPGTYYMQYVIQDAFMRPLRLEMVQLYWDGEKFTIQNDSWERGTETLDATGYYSGQ